MKNIIASCVAMINAGKKVILVAPLRRIPELRTMLLQEGMVSSVLTSHLTITERETVLSEANIIITPPAMISNGVDLKGYSSVMLCWEEEMQGTYLDMLKARLSAPTPRAKVV